MDRGVDLNTQDVELATLDALWEEAEARHKRATEAFGDGNRYVDILEANPSLRGDPGRIVPGQELVLPTN